MSTPSSKSDAIQARILEAQQDAVSDDAEAETKLLTALSDPAPQVRLAVLEALSQRTPSDELRARVIAISENDTNLLVRGRASILKSDWNLSTPGKSTVKQQPKTPSSPRTRNRSRSETGTLTPRSPILTQAQRNSSTQTPSLAEPRTDLLPIPNRTDPLTTGNAGAHAASRSPTADPLELPDVQQISDESVELPPLPLEQRIGRSGRGHDAFQGRGSANLFTSQRRTRFDANDDLFIRPQIEDSEFGDPDGTFRVDEPGFLSDPIEPLHFADSEPELDYQLFTYESDEPLGFAGPSGILPTEDQESAHFVPIEDRWRVGIPAWDRYTFPTPVGADAPFELGQWWNPYRQHVLKGDYPIIGQHTFLNMTASSVMLHEVRQVPTPTTPFESTVNPFSEDFFGNPNQYFYNHFFRLKFDLFHGNAGFKPVDWRIVAEPVFNMNYLDVEELGIVNTNVRAGTTRFRDYMALEQWFVEAKLADLSPHYDFLSIRAGSQPFVSDFRGFIFSDINRGVRLFGTLEANRDQFNLAVFSQQEKDTNSGLNTFHDRDQTVFIANYYRQDFIFPGYTAQGSVHYDHDEPSFKFDKNNFLVRPDPAGIFQQHQLDVAYLGFAGEGHIDRFNIAHAFYWALGRDSLNPIAGQPQDVNAQMAAIELSYDRDWVRFRGSYFFSSGDDDVDDDRAQGFDAIFDNPNFAGGQFSYWQRQSIRLFGVGLVQRESLIPNLRSSKTQGQANFVNPGLNLLNLGMDFEVTPKLRVITNANYLWFDTTEVLEQFVFQSDIHREIGVDLSLGTEYRPLLNDNVIVLAGVSTLLPGRGFKDLYEQSDPLGLFKHQDTHLGPLVAAFVELSLTF